MGEVSFQNENLVEEKAVGSLAEEVSEEAVKEKSKEEKNLLAQANDQQYNPKRQSFCYIFLLERRTKPNELTLTEIAEKELKKEKEN